MKDNEYKCGVCGGIFETTVSEEDMLKEQCEGFGENPPEDRVMECDDCYREFMGWYLNSCNMEIEAEDIVPEKILQNMNTEKQDDTIDIKETITPEGNIGFFVALPLPECLKKALEAGKITPEEIERYIERRVSHEMTHKLYQELEKWTEEMIRGHGKDEPVGMAGSEESAARE